MHISDRLAEWIPCAVLKILAVIPQRVTLSLLGFMAIVNAYTMRLCMDLALTQIIKWNNAFTAPIRRHNMLMHPIQLRNITQELTEFASWNLTRPLIEASLKTMYRIDRNAPERYIDHVYNWSPQMQTSVQTSFYIGYIVSHIPGAILVERYGGTNIIFYSTLIAAILTILTPTAIKARGPIALIALRCAIGISEGPIFPAVCSLLAHWVPPKERGKWCVFVLSGGQLGVFLVNICSTLLLRHCDWMLLFYIYGGCAIIWVAVFAKLSADNPDLSSFVDPKERAYLDSEMKCVMTKEDLPSTPWKEIFQSVPTWALISASMQHEWMQAYSLKKVKERLRSASELPLSESLEYTLQATAPNVVNWLISVVSGCVSDVCVQRRIISVTTARKVMILIAAFCPYMVANFISCFTCASNFSSIFSCAVASMGTYYSGIRLTAFDLSPNYAASIMAITNTFGSISALLGSYMTDYNFHTPTFKQMHVFFWLLCAIFSSGVTQSYDSFSGNNASS